MRFKDKRVYEEVMYLIEDNTEIKLLLDIVQHFSKDDQRKLLTYVLKMQYDMTQPSPKIPE